MPKTITRQDVLLYLSRAQDAASDYVSELARTVTPLGAVLCRPYDGPTDALCKRLDADFGAALDVVMRFGAEELELPE